MQESIKMDGAIVFTPHVNFKRRILDAWSLIRTGLSVACGKPAVLHLDNSETRHLFLGNLELKLRETK